VWFASLLLSAFSFFIVPNNSLFQLFSYLLFEKGEETKQKIKYNAYIRVILYVDICMYAGWNEAAEILCMEIWISSFSPLSNEQF